MGNHALPEGLGERGDLAQGFRRKRAHVGIDVVDDRAVDVAGIVGGEEEDGVGDVARRAEAAERLADGVPRDEPAEDLARGDQPFVAQHLEGTSDGDAADGELLGELGLTRQETTTGEVTLDDA